MTVNPDGKADEMDDDSGTGLPASIEAAWGLRERPHKGPKRGLSLERIVDAAMKAADSDGIGAVSMSRVAADLGASTMSLYRYVTAKDELLALMVDAAFGKHPAVPVPGEGWRAGLSRCAWALISAYRQHPWALRIPLSGPPATPNQVAWMEATLGSLHDTRLAEDEKLSVILLISGYVRNVATMELDISEAFRAAGGTPDEVMSAYGRLIARLTDPQRFPALTAVIKSGVMDKADDPDDEFIFGLERILDGIDALVRARAT
jgi:AcrR family transcriptional regulator